MDEAVQQNAALVEEAYGTSENLASAAREMNQRMEKFTIRSKQNLLPKPKK
jgi:methyl-accepting chemotaxis protein